MNNIYKKCSTICSTSFSLVSARLKSVLRRVVPSSDEGATLNTARLKPVLQAVPSPVEERVRVRSINSALQKKIPKFCTLHSALCILPTLPRRTRFSVAIFALLLITTIVASIPQVFALFSNPAGGSPASGAGHAVRQPAAVTNGMVAHYKFDGDATDSVANTPNTLTDNNTVTQAVGPGGVGSAAQFTAANSEYLSITSNTSLQPRSSSFSIGGWVYLDSKTSYRTIARKWNSSLVSKEFGLFYSSADDKFVFATTSDGSSANIVYAVNFGSPSISTWYYVVGWFDSSTGTINIQVNNGSVDSVSVTGGIYAGVADLVIGRNQDSATHYMDGRIARVGLWKKALSASERTALYNSGTGLYARQLTDPMKQKLVSYWDLEEASGTRADSYGAVLHSNNDGTPTNFASVASNYTSSISKYGKGLTFDGVDDFVSQGSNTSLNITGNITVSFWGKFVGPAIMCVVCGFNPSDASTGYQVWMNYASSGKMRFRSGNIAADTTYASFNDGNLHHFAASLSGTTVSLYIDGIWEKDATVGVPTSWAGVHSVGAKNDGTSPTNGTLDDVRIYNRALTADEITTLYSGSAPQNPDQNIVGWWKLDEVSGNAVDSTGFSETLTATNIIYKFPSVFGNGYKFNGAQGSGRLTSSSVLSSATQNFTVSFWAYIQDTAHRIFWNGTDGGGYYFDLGNGMTMQVTTPSVGTVISNIGVQSNRWTLVTATHDASTWRLYLNGRLTGTGNYAVSTPTGHTEIGNCSTNGNYFSGSIDDVRVYNRALTASEVNEMYLAGRP